MACVVCLIYEGSIPIFVVNRFKRCLCCVVSTINKAMRKKICLKIRYSLRQCIRITWNSPKMDGGSSVNLDLNIFSEKMFHCFFQQSGCWGRDFGSGFRMFIGYS